MITDQDVIQEFGQFADIPPDAKLDSQFFRGENTFPVGCDRHLDIFSRFKVIPKYCFDCFKVLISPRNVIEQFKLLMLLEKISLPNDNRRKCMVEERGEFGGTYKGYVFCNGIEEGKAVLKIVRKAVTEEIAPQVGVSLKRGCSEYAVVYPSYADAKSASTLMRYRPEWQVQEEQFDRTYMVRHIPDDRTDIAWTSPDGSRQYTRREIHCMQYWLCYAATIGDASYLALSGRTMPRIPNLVRPPFKNTIPVKK